MKAQHIIRRNYSRASIFDGIDTVREKITQKRYIVVMDGDDFKGLLTPSDIIKSPRNLILDCIQKKPAIDYGQSIDSILVTMNDSGFDELPVLKDGVFEGVVIKSELVDFFSEYNQELEKQIDENTKKLQQINRQLRKEIQDRQVAEEKNRELIERLHQTEKVSALGNLAAGIAHDFNNILSPIIGYSETALNDVQPGSSLWHDINEIYTAGKRAKKIIRQILKYARQGEQVLKPVEVKAILDEGLKLIKASFPTSVTIDQQIKTHAAIKASSTAIHQIYLNLCTNALHAIEKNNGTIKIRAKNIRFFHDSESVPDGILPGEYVELSVSDNGIGILPEHITCVFDPYFTTKPVGKGTGLGLSTVFGIVRGLNGAIKIDSLPGQGTSVYVYLPVSEKNIGVQKKPSVQIQKGHEKILFVDDEEAIIKLFQKSLERAGYRVVTQTDPLEALMTFKSEAGAFDLVITDMTMPGMKGDTFAFEIKRIRPEIPIILCTGYSDAYTENKMNELGLSAVAHKPILFADLIALIQSVLEKHAGKTPSTS